MTVQAFVIDKKYFEVELENPLIADSGFVFDGEYYYVHSVVSTSIHEPDFLHLRYKA